MCFIFLFPKHENDDQRIIKTVPFVIQITNLTIQIFLKVMNLLKCCYMIFILTAFTDGEMIPNIHWHITQTFSPNAVDRRASVNRTVTKVVDNRTSSY